MADLDGVEGPMLGSHNLSHVEGLSQIGWRWPTHNLPNAVDDLCATEQLRAREAELLVGT